MTHEHSHDHNEHAHHHHAHTHSHSHGHTHSNSHGHTHTTQGHSHHHHTHGDGSSEMGVKEKLHHLLKHWVDHNNSHKDTYLSWAKRAEAEGLSEVARHLEAADAASAAITASLEKALTSITH